MHHLNEGRRARWLSRASWRDCYHPAMAPSPSSLALHRNSRLLRVALLWLALLVALAQTLAVAHASTHGPDETTAQAAGKHPGGLAHCLSCIVAAAVGGAAPPASALPLAVATHPAPLAVALAVFPASPQSRPYAIRAPPRLAS
jgi:hypothetical protein